MPYPLPGTNDHVGGRVAFTVDNTGVALAFTGNGTVQSPNFYATAGQTQITFAINAPTQPVTWIPYMIMPNGAGNALLGTGRAITANNNDAATFVVSGGAFYVIVTNTNNTSGTIPNIYIQEGLAAG
jgi:hypothetical protein